MYYLIAYIIYSNYIVEIGYHKEKQGIFCK